MQKRDYKNEKLAYFFVIFSFLIWRIGLLVIAFLSIHFLSLFSFNYLGGGILNYRTNPLFWGHINFDGEHYLAIAQYGYKPLEYFFFPLYPVLIRALAFLKTNELFALIGIFISNLSFLIALIGIYKLIKLDFKESVAKLTLILFLIFPTSFYFGAYYTESIFLAFIVWSFYLIRKQKYLSASILTALASATKIIGGVMFLILLIEWFLRKKKNISNLLAIVFVSPLGILLYIYYLWKQTGDGLFFLHQISIFGQQRSSNLISLPQVIYRYIFQILPHVSYSFFPNVFTTYLEFTISIVFFVLIIYGFWKLRISYSIYALIAYIIPTLSGSFSSMPRYILVIFPVFILTALLLDKVPKFYKYLLFSVMLILMIISTAMFWRGYWLS